jgi:hypothetical protein
MVSTILSERERLTSHMLKPLLDGCPDDRYCGHRVRQAEVEKKQ